MITKEQYITKNKVYTIAGFSSTVMWTIGFVLALRQGWGDFWNAILPICLICIPIIIFSILMVMMSLLWYIGFEDDEVIYRNMFGIKKTYNVDELRVEVCTKKNRGGTLAYIYHEDKKITRISVYDQRLELLARFKSKK